LKPSLPSNDSDCPFCASKLDRNSIVDRLSIGNNEIISVKNLFPAVSLDNPEAYGVQEVTIDTPDHGRGLGDFSEEEIADLLMMYAKRSTDLAKIPKINYILCFKNQGAAAGASLAHAHSQIFATTVTPPDLRLEARLAKQYFNRHGNCPYCDIIKKEIRSPRLIFADRQAAAFTPYASEYHYEAWVFARKHVDNISLASSAQIKSIAKALKLITSKLKLIDLPFNYFMHNVISNGSQHLYIKIQPRDSVWAGVELGSGLIINSVPPEMAAKFYRK
jgi:UDPglucose--hexose-1-phosphate uridylyltransferase